MEALHQGLLLKLNGCAVGLTGHFFFFFSSLLGLMTRRLLVT